MLAKRIFDFVSALVSLIVLLPVFLMTAILIKIDSCGPVFFRQARVGRNGAEFTIFKFRTMEQHAESKGQITIGRDSRITRVGHVLRRYKLDELPQLLNILFGDMSFVGPRPEVPKYVAHYPAGVRETVLSVAPGITDWASIRFKDENDILGDATEPERTYVEEILPIKLNYYVRYVNERSFALDLKIIFFTAFAVFNRTHSSANRNH